SQGRKRYSLTIVVAHIEQAQVLRPGSIVTFGLHVHLPLPAKPVEVVNEVAAHESLQRFVDLRQVDAFLKSLISIHVHIKLRHNWKKRRVDAGDFWPLPGRFHELADVGGKEGDVFARAVLQHKVESAGRADALDRGRRKGEGDGSWYTRQRLGQMCLNRF